MADILRLLWSGRRQEEDLVDELVDRLMELSRVDPVPESGKLLLLLLRDGIGFTQAIEGGSGLVEASFETLRLALGSEHRIMAIAELLDADPPHPVCFDEIRLTSNMMPSGYFPLLLKNYGR